MNIKGPGLFLVHGDRARPKAAFGLVHLRTDYVAKDDENKLIVVERGYYSEDGFIVLACKKE